MAANSKIHNELKYKICTINCPMPISPWKIICRLEPSPIDRLDGGMVGLAAWIRQWKDWADHLLLRRLCTIIICTSHTATARPAY